MAEDNLPSQRHVDYYREKARGGIGMIVTEALRVHPTSVTNSTAVAGYDERVVPWLRRIADAIHGEGVPVICQILHNGRQHSPYWSRLPLWAPSPVPGYYNHETPHEMSESEIQEVLDGCAATALHVAASGYDGIEIHAAHGYLLQQFMSPISNQRSDRYGGSLENRVRLVREVIGVVRRAAPTLVVGIRISGSEFTPGGLDIGDMCEIAPLLVGDGDIDYISVSQSNYEGTSFSTMIPDVNFAPGSFAYLARDIKQAVPDVAVLAVGRINAPELAEKIITDTGVDLIGMNRATIADPELGLKARRGDAGRIRPCIALNVCWGGGAIGRAFSCAVNPTAGKEAKWGEGTLTPSQDPLRVVVVGAGPAGLEAARTLAIGGHEVVLLEKTEYFGGQLRLAARAPGRAELVGFADWAARELVRLKVDIRPRTEASPELVLSLAPDAVVVATGSVSSLGRLAAATGRVINGRDVLGDESPLGARVLVVDREWAWQAPCIAEYLHDRGVRVELATEKLNLGVLLPANVLPTLYARLDEKQIPVRTLARAIDVANGSVTFEHPLTLRTWREAGYDGVVVAGDSRSDDGLYRELKDRHAQVIAVGDCVAPRQVIEAVHDGHRAARQIHESHLRAEAPKN